MSHFRLFIRRSPTKGYGKSISTSSNYLTAITILCWFFFILYLPEAMAMDFGTYTSSCQANGGTATIGKDGVYQCNFAQSATPVGSASGMQQQLMMQGAGIVGQAIGNSILQSLVGNPQQDAASQAAAQAAAAQAAEQQRQADQEAMRQQELVKQRILGAIKDTSQAPALGLKTGDVADAPLQVTRVKDSFGTTALVPVNTVPDSGTGNGLQLKLGDDADNSSMQAGQGFDTAGKIQGSDLPPPPPTPASKPIAQKIKLLKALKAKLERYETAEQSLKDKLAQLQQAPTLDPAAINQIQEKIAVKETEKKKIMLDLTAADPDAPGTVQTSDSPDSTPAGAIPAQVSP